MADPSRLSRSQSFRLGSGNRVKTRSFPEGERVDGNDSLGTSGTTYGNDFGNDLGAGRSSRSRKAPFPWFGGKSSIAAEVWQRIGQPKQYIEPFCGSAAVLLQAPRPALLEVIGDQNCYVANFWRTLKCQTHALWAWQDYPVSHIDLFARHRWLTEPDRVATLRAALMDPEWPGDPQIAGWWLWGQCCWIGSGWCDPSQHDEGVVDSDGLLGKIPFVGSRGRGTQAGSLGNIPHVTDAGMGIQALRDDARQWLGSLADRLARVRIIHGDWTRCLNYHYGTHHNGTVAIFLDPPYRSFESLYSDGSAPVADAVCAWAAEHADLRIALCGHRGDYDLPGWSIKEWSRDRLTYGGRETTDAECIWFSPVCLGAVQGSLFDRLGEP